MKIAIRNCVCLLLCCLVLMAASCKKDSFAGNYQSADGDQMLTLTKEGKFSISSRSNPGATVSGDYDKKGDVVTLKPEGGASVAVAEFTAKAGGRSLEGGGVIMIRQDE